MFQRKLRSFNEVMNAINKIPNINAGGCGISALAMYMWIEKNEKHKPTILFCYQSHSKKRYDNNKQALNSKNSTLEVPNHVALIYQRKKIDSNGIIWDFKPYYKYHHRVNLTKLKDTIIKSPDWNCEFDRKKYLKKIESIIDMKMNVQAIEEVS